MPGVGHQDLHRHHPPVAVEPSAAGSDRRCPRAPCESCVRICACWCAGNWSMMRLIVEDAELVCSVRERQVAGLGDAQRRLDRLEVAHFADEHDVGVLAEGGAERVREALRVAVHLALVDQAALVLVEVLDRVLDGEDVPVLLGVDLVDHRRQRGRLAAAGRPGDQHQAARAVGELGDHRRQLQLLEAADALGNLPVGRRRPRRAGCTCCSGSGPGRGCRTRSRAPASPRSASSGRRSARCR